MAVRDVLGDLVLFEVIVVVVVLVDLVRGLFVLREVGPARRCNRGGTVVRLGGIGRLLVRGVDLGAEARLLLLALLLEQLVRHLEPSLLLRLGILAGGAGTAMVGSAVELLLRRTTLGIEVVLAPLLGLTTASNGDNYSLGLL
jgi:hypothetical protein